MWHISRIYIMKVTANSASLYIYTTSEGCVAQAFLCHGIAADDLKFQGTCVLYVELLRIVNSDS